MAKVPEMLGILKEVVKNDSTCGVDHWVVSSNEGVSVGQAYVKIWVEI